MTNDNNDLEKAKELAILKVEVNDLLNKVLIKLQGVIKTGKYGSDQEYLKHLKTYIERVLEDQHEARRYEDQYHTSYCY